MKIFFLIMQNLVLILIIQLVIAYKVGNIMNKKSDNKTTSKEIASEASRILRDKRFSETSKSVAGSALAQTKQKKPSKD